jgi:hypothetical protein
MACALLWSDKKTRKHSSTVCSRSYLLAAIALFGVGFTSLMAEGEAKSADDLEIVRLKRSAGGNYDVSAEDVLQRLAMWRCRCDFEVLGAGGSWVAIRFKTLPQNICQFAEEIYEFCPDSVEQGTSCLNENRAPEKFDAARRLCPRLSEKMQRKLYEETARIAAMDISPEFREWLQSSPHAFTTSTEMGIRLLAYELKQTKWLFLWWD